MCVCVWEREAEREREADGGGGGLIDYFKNGDEFFTAEWLPAIQD